jgi:Fe-S cluster biosynthesis and repair protein YggX
MSRTIHCASSTSMPKAWTSPPGLARWASAFMPKSPKPAWQQWLSHQTMLINEYRLNPLDPKARKYLAEEMEKFLFGGDLKTPEGYVAPEYRVLTKTAAHSV